MTFAVSWTADAEEALADIWLHAPDRKDVVAAGNRLDRALVRDPLTYGESRVGPSRFVYEDPLAVLFDVDPAAGTVKVWHVWRPR